MKEKKNENQKSIYYYAWSNKKLQEKTKKSMLDIIANCDSFVRKLSSIMIIFMPITSFEESESYMI